MASGSQTAGEPGRLAHGTAENQKGDDVGHMRAHGSIMQMRLDLTEIKRADYKEYRKKPWVESDVAQASCEESLVIARGTTYPCSNSKLIRK